MEELRAAPEHQPAVRSLGIFGAASEEIVNTFLE